MAMLIYHLDDDAEEAGYICSLIAECNSNCAVKTFQDETQLTVAIAARVPDLVLLDLVLGPVSGIDVLSRINSNYPGLRIIMLSGSDEPRMIDAAHKAGASAYFVKPFGEASTKHLLKTVVSWPEGMLYKQGIPQSFVLQ